MSDTTTPYEERLRETVLCCRALLEVLPDDDILGSGLQVLAVTLEARLRRLRRLASEETRQRPPLQLVPRSTRS